MKIRKAEQSDVKTAGEFYDKVVKYLVEHINYPKWKYGIYPSEASVKAAVDKGEQFVLEDCGKIVGAFVLNSDPQGRYSNGRWSKPLNEGEYFVIHALAVDFERRGEGLGKRSVEFCLGFAAAHGAGGVRLDVVPSNIPARKLYESLGFTYAGDADLERGTEDIPLFSLYEKNF